MWGTSAGKNSKELLLESTSPPGTCSDVLEPIFKLFDLKAGKDYYLAHCPERVLPGYTLKELIQNDKIIGGIDKESAEKAAQFYKVFIEGNIYLTDFTTAEMVKLMENTYRDINIAFANELTKICRADDLDVYEIIRIANKHPRVNILQPGPGVGGHCISVDPWFLVGDYLDLTSLILTARKINDCMSIHVLERIGNIMIEHNIKDVSKVGLYGLTYEENVNDIRESPTLQLLKKMDEHLSFGVKVFDPFINTKIVDKQYCNFEKFVNEIEIIVILVAHEHIKKNMDLIKEKLILDTKNICTFDGVYKL